VIKFRSVVIMWSAYPVNIEPIASAILVFDVFVIIGTLCLSRYSDSIGVSACCTVALTYLELNCAQYCNIYIYMYLYV
jgi:hypothetical protein